MQLIPQSPSKIVYQIPRNGRNYAYPGKFAPINDQRARYKVAHGGRGSAKSWSFARKMVEMTADLPLRCLCTREIQSSIKDSVFRLLCDQIHAMKLDREFTIQRDTIFSRAGAEILFKGLRHNISEIKSTEGIDICWVEEAEKVSEDSWTTLIPTIRSPNSEIWISFNPEDENSPTYTRFVKNPPPDSIVVAMNFEDNGWFPDVLRREMEYDKRVDFEKYQHVWMGLPKKYGNALIFKGKVRVEDFETPPGMQFYHGIDFGFSNDPCAVARMFIHNNRLWIDYESYGVGVEIDELPAFIEHIPTLRREHSTRWKLMADSARPDTISHLRGLGFNIVGAEKGKGSVEDGIEFIRSFEEIIIHTRCPGAKGDFMNYRWKTDRITGDIIPVPADGSDHVPDLTRYALEAYIKRKTTIFDVL